MVGNQIDNLNYIHLAITYVVNTQMDHVSLFWTLKFQKLSNGIRNFSIQWVLSLQITLYRFESPLGFQLPKWESIWECVGLFLHIPLHFQKRECDLWVAFFVHIFPYLCFRRWFLEKLCFHSLNCYFDFLYHICNTGF